MQRAMTRDDVLRSQYARTSQAVDEIVGDPEILAKFIDLVNSDLPQSEQFGTKDLCMRLFTLRKRGEDNGGLVRKHRQFNGRNNKPR